PVAVEVRDQLRELVGEVVGAERVGAAAQRPRGARVGAGCAADAEVDAAGVLLASAAAAVEPEPIGTRSSTERDTTPAATTGRPRFFRCCSARSRCHTQR